jgi:lysophospholipase L1-like esterase
MKIWFTEIIKIVVFWGALVIVVPGYVTGQSGTNAVDVSLDSCSMEPRFLVNPHYLTRVAEIRVDSQRTITIVMLGNSITQGGNWSTLLGREDVSNQGIVSDVVAGFFNRLEGIIDRHPRICFIMGGINDIYDDTPVDIIFSTYTEIIDSLQAAGIIPLIQSTLYVSPRWHNAAIKNPEVQHLNARLRTLAGGKDLEFIDLNALLADKGELRAEFTRDGVHLTPAAYSVWAKEILRILEKYKI